MAESSEYNIGEAFAVIEDYLIDSMRRNMLRHIGKEQQEHISWSQWQADMISGLREYKRENADKFKGIYPVIEQKIEQTMWEAYDTGEAVQEQAILAAIRQGFTKYRPKNTQNGEFFRMNKRKMNALVDETSHSMAKATAAALRMANDQYRSIIFGAQVFYNSGAGTLWQAVDMASKKFLSAGLNCIEYRNGSRVNIASYAEMALRTANTRAYLHGEAAMRERYGIHTVIVNRHNAACPLCVPFQGRVFIDDVWGGGTAAEAQTKGYPLLSEAMAAGLYHPNCKDGHTTFFAGINEFHPPTARMKEEQVRRYELQQQQRYHERQIRKYKRLCQGTIDEETRIGYTKKLHEWQNRTQELIDANPKILRRSPPREKLRNIPEELGITPPRNPPGVEIFVKPPPEKPPDNKIRSVIDVKAYSKPKTPPSIGPSEAERKRDIEKIKAKARLVRQKADEMQIDAKIARYNADVASHKAKIARYNAERLRQEAEKKVRTLKVKARFRDRLVFYERDEANRSIADARKVRAYAEIAKTEERAAKRRYQTLLKLENGGRLTVSVNTATTRPISVKVKPTAGTASAVSTDIQTKMKTRWERLENIIGQNWLREIKDGRQIDEISRMLHKMDDRRLRFLERYGNLIKGDFYSAKGPHTVRGFIEMNLSAPDQRSNALEYQYTNIYALLHESGHAMDYSLNFRHGIRHLRGALEEDFISYASVLLGRELHAINNLTAAECNKISDSLRNDFLSGVSDIADGLTNGRIHGVFGHSWIEGFSWTNESLLSEAVANLFEAFMNGGETYEEFKRRFPKSMQLFEEYFDKLI